MVGLSSASFASVATGSVDAKQLANDHLLQSSPMLSVIERLFPIPLTGWFIHIQLFLRSALANVVERVPPSPFDVRPLTYQQRKLLGNEFVHSIDTDAVCALASRYNGGLSCQIRRRCQGSFNVCFILDFADGTTRVVRLPIEPMVHDVWEKVCSEVYTMQYVQEHTSIPVPRVYAYGRGRLRQDTSAYQVFMILECIDGQPLTKKMLRDASGGCRRQFLGELVDMLAQLRGLEFSCGGSLSPKTTDGIWSQLRKFVFPSGGLFTPQSSPDLTSKPKIVGAFSMRKNELQMDGYTTTRSMASSLKDFITEQSHLLQYMW
ncbi:hypothetical protein DL546_001236 [Coniochaeta pulveracea]|uniref:Aminoglycoside phosphotransferase domain-containing protein n=1 Tax=Coniochaeta pulveracea TaxID=177199 RepID=A0A420Y0E4_9PEZI|nr:hypothetical protein DL546_001236 [Coniochaeta pulveracea]